MLDKSLTDCPKSIKRLGYNTWMKQEQKNCCTRMQFQTLNSQFATSLMRITNSELEGKVQVVEEV